MPELSVIVPVYNTEKYLRKAIDSLLNQTYKDIEVLLINDGSTDNSGAICDEYSLKDNRVRVFHKQNEGQGKARNLGVEKAQGEYITFLDSDDFIDPITYEKIIASTKEYDLDINRFRYAQFIEEAVVKINNTYIQPVVYQDKKEIRQAALCLFSAPVNGIDKDLNFGGSACCAIYKRSLLIDNNIKFPSNSKYVCEDFLFNFYCLQYAKSVGTSETVFYHYRVNPISTTHKPNLKIVSKSVDTCRFLEQEIVRYGYDERAISYAQGFSVDILRSYLKNMFTSSMSLCEKLSWTREQSRIDYFRDVYEKYNWRALSFKHKLNFWAFYRRKTLLLYTLIVGQEQIRKMLSNIMGDESKKFGKNSKRRH